MISLDLKNKQTSCQQSSPRSYIRDELTQQVLSPLGVRDQYEVPRVLPELNSPHYPTVGGAVCIIFQRALCKHYWALNVKLCIQRPQRLDSAGISAQAARAEPHIGLSPLRQKLRGAKHLLVLPR